MDDPSDQFALLSEAERASAHDGLRAQCANDGEVESPVPADAPATPMAHHNLGKPVASWTYRDAYGAVLFHVWRFEPRGERKQIRPLSLWRDAKGLRWRWAAVPAPRPLYGLDWLAAHPDAPVVICEGEKSADAAGRVFPDHFATTSPGGAQ